MSHGLGVSNKQVTQTKWYKWSLGNLIFGWYKMYKKDLCQHFAFLSILNPLSIINKSVWAPRVKLRIHVGPFHVSSYYFFKIVWRKCFDDRSYIGTVIGNTFGTPLKPFFVVKSVKKFNFRSLTNIIREKWLNLCPFFSLQSAWFLFINRLIRL